MKEYKVIHLAELNEAPGTPDEGYWKLYPKGEGFFILDSAGNEVLIQSLLFVDQDNVVLDQKSIIEIQSPLMAMVDGDRIVITIDIGDADGIFVHDNESHVVPYATEEDLQAHIDNTTEVHGLVIAEVLALLHEQGTDMQLGLGTEWHITVQQIHNLLVAQGSSGVLKTSDAETNVSSSYNSYLGDTSGGNVGFVLPAAATHNGFLVRFRKTHANNALSVYRSGDNNIIHNEDIVTSVSLLAEGDWVSVQSDGTNWHVIMDSIT